MPYVSYAKMVSPGRTSVYHIAERYVGRTRWSPCCGAHNYGQRISLRDLTESDASLRECKQCAQIILKRRSAIDKLIGPTGTSKLVLMDLERAVDEYDMADTVFGHVVKDIVLKHYHQEE